MLVNANSNRALYKCIRAAPGFFNKRRIVHPTGLWKKQYITDPLRLMGDAELQQQGDITSLECATEASHYSGVVSRNNSFKHGLWYNFPSPYLKLDA